MEGTSEQALEQFISSASPWDYEKLNFKRIQYMLENAVADEGMDGMLIFDNTGIEKKGNCSVGVARQYSGILGKVGNCQVVVSCQYTDNRYTWPVNARLYLPKEWAENTERLKKAKVPEGIEFKTKVQIALELLDQANQLGVKHEVIGADSFYGGNPEFIEGLEQRGEKYAVSVPGDFTVRFTQDIKTFVPPTKEGSKKRGRPKAKPERTPLPPQYRVDSLVAKLPKDYWKVICWREGSKGELKKEFAFLRVHWGTSTKVGEEGWLIFEKPVDGEKGDIKYYFSNLSIDTPYVKLVEYVHRRHTIERFYQDAKSELGLDQYEGRSWKGLHKHWAMVMLVYCWLILERRYEGYTSKQYEIVVDRPVVEGPNFNSREIFSPETLYR